MFVKICFCRPGNDISPFDMGYSENVTILIELQDDVKVGRIELVSPIGIEDFIISYILENGTNVEIVSLKVIVFVYHGLWES